MISETLSHYKILDKLGAGGMGDVYEAIDTQSNRTVALKFLAPELTRDEEAQKRFIREAETASSLDHPNICTVNEIGQDDGHLFISMELYEGETLQGRIARERVPYAESLEIARQIAEGLSAAHSKGVIHRDIKPSNIMITHDGQLKILDFGLAKLTSSASVTQAGMTSGTVSYMSPEQTEGKKVDARTDLWALGVVLYQMLTGELPFKGTYDQAVIYSILNEEPPDPTGLAKDVPLRIKTILDKLLAKKPEDRFQTAQDFIAELLEEKKAFTESEIIAHRRKIQRVFATALVAALVFVTIRMIPPIWNFFVGIFGPDYSVAVLAFENQTGDPAQERFASLIPNAVTTRFESYPRMQVTTWERLGDLCKQHHQQDCSVFDETLGVLLCQKAGIDLAVAGSISRVGETVKMEARIIDVDSRDIKGYAYSEGVGYESILTSQIDQLSSQTALEIGLYDSEVEYNQQDFSELGTASLEAYEHYLEGWEHFANSVWGLATLAFEKAVNLDSNFTLAHFGIQHSASQPGGSNTDYQLATKHAEKAWKLRHRVSEKYRYMIEAWYAADWAREPDNEMAIEIFEKLVKRYPNEKWAHYDLAYQYQMENRLEEAVRENNEVLRLDPTFLHGKAHNRLAYIYRSLNEPDSVFAHIHKYVSQSPDDYNTYDSWGEMLMWAGRFDEAIEKYSISQTNHPQSAVDRFHRHKIYAMAQTENYDLVFETLDKSLLNANRSDSVWISFFKVFYNGWTGRIDEAVKEHSELETLISRRSLWASLVLACAFYDNGRTTNAAQLVDSLLLLVKPDFGPRFFFRGLADLMRGDLRSAEKWADSLEAAPVIPAFAYLWGEQSDVLQQLINLENGTPKNAIESDFSFEHQMGVTNLFASWANLAFDYNVPFSWDVKARAYEAVGEIDAAINEYEHLITFDPKYKGWRLINPKYYYRLARLYEKKGWPGLAIKQYGRFLELYKNADPDLLEVITAKERLKILKG